MDYPVAILEAGHFSGDEDAQKSKLKQLSDWAKSGGSIVLNKDAVTSYWKTTVGDGSRMLYLGTPESFERWNREQSQ